MQITQAEFERRLSSQKNLANSLSRPNNSKQNQSNKKLSAPNGHADSHADSNSQSAATQKSGDQQPKIAVISQPQAVRRPAVPPAIRTTAAILAESGEPIAEIAKQFQMTPGQVQAARNSPILKQNIDRGVERIRDLALDKLMMALGLMTEDKFQNADLKDLSSTAANLSRVYERTGQRLEQQTNIQLIVYAPEQKPMSGYKVIDV